MTGITGGISILTLLDGGQNLHAYLTGKLLKCAISLHLFYGYLLVLNDGKERSKPSLHNEALLENFQAFTAKWKDVAK